MYTSSSLAPTSQGWEWERLLRWTRALRDSWERWVRLSCRGWSGWCGTCWERLSSRLPACPHTPTSILEPGSPTVHLNLARGIQVFWTWFCSGLGPLLSECQGCKCKAPSEMIFLIGDSKIEFVWGELEIWIAEEFLAGTHRIELIASLCCEVRATAVQSLRILGLRLKIKLFWTGALLSFKLFL